MLIDETEVFDRKKVSFQLSKNQAVHGWLKYKEAFSQDLVAKLLDLMQVKANDLILDPFLGSGTTALVCKQKGIKSLGFDILPTSTLALRVKSKAWSINTQEIEKLFEKVKELEVPGDYQGTLNTLAITQGAFSDSNEHFLAYLKEYVDRSSFSPIVKDLVKLCMSNALEPCSYTAKSGQYLSWDSRSPKIIEINKKRLEKRQTPLKPKCVRAQIADAKSQILKELTQVISDLKNIQSSYKSQKTLLGEISYVEKSALFALPTLASDSISGVITSPPYCNRYDYTRTYALELAFLGLDEAQVKALRQELLTCTVENRSKIDDLKLLYQSLGKEQSFEEALSTIKRNKALAEVIEALKERFLQGDLNNRQVIRMVEGYFVELGLLIFELQRILKKGAYVAMVNDNVRFAGEVIPVDLILTDLATSFGFSAVKVFTLKQKKGNSSQQMAKFGKVSLRKSITLWQKV